jgi:hypothetical protein
MTMSVAATSQNSAISAPSTLFSAATYCRKLSVTRARATVLMSSEARWMSVRSTSIGPSNTGRLTRKPDRGSGA